MRILAIGFSDSEVEKLRELVGDVVCIPEYCKDLVVEEIIQRDSLEGRCDWHFQRFIIIHGASSEEIKKIIKTVKTAFNNVIFAVTTPISLTWRLEELLNELIREHQYFMAMKSFKLG